MKTQRNAAEQGCGFSMRAEVAIVFFTGVALTAHAGFLFISKSHILKKIRMLAGRKSI